MKNIIFKKRVIWIELLIWSIFIGSICFVLVYGIDSLNVTNDKWLLNSGDLNQHYVGWKFFRRSNWRFPFGLIEGITETPISIIYTDSIPLFAVLFKLASPVLPKTFQYFGLWGIMCFILQAYFAMMLLNVFIKEKFAIINGSIFFVMSPIVLMRMFGHTALGGNWLILAALSAWAYRKTVKGIRSNVIIWSTLMVLAVTVHMYYIPMVLAIMCASYLNQILDDKKEKIVKLSIVTIGIAIASALVIMYALGAFYGEPGVLQGGLRMYSANLNTFYNPLGTSRFIRAYAIISESQWEGYGYLGLGIILILILGIIGMAFNRKRIVKKDKNFILSLFILILILGGYALSPSITWNNKILFDIPWPEAVIKVFSIFRVTGRYIWPVYYIIFTLAIVLLKKVYSNKIAYPLLIVGIVLQLADISPLIKGASKKVEADIPSSIIQNSAWGDMKGEFDKIEFITSFSKIGDPNVLLVNFFSMKEVFDVANYACDSQMNINDFYIGRRNGKYIEETKYSNWSDLIKGNVNERTIYIFSDIPYILIDNPNINIYQCDGFIIGVSSKYIWRNEPENRVIDVDVDVIGESSYIENGIDIDGQRIIHPNGISYGPYVAIGEGTYEVIAEGENLNLGYFDVISTQKNEVIPINNLKVSSKKASFNIKLLEPIYDIEIRLANNKDENIILKKLNIQKIGDEN